MSRDNNPLALYSTAWLTFRARPSAQARKDEWELVADVTFHDLRHDFAHRARLAIQTTVRYTQVSREQVKNKLRLLRG